MIGKEVVLPAVKQRNREMVRGRDKQPGLGASDDDLQTASMTAQATGRVYSRGSTGELQ